MRRPPTAACGGTSPTRGERKRSVGEAAPTQSVGARGIENSSSERGDSFPVRPPPTAACGGTSPTGDGPPFGGGWGKK